MKQLPAHPAADIFPMMSDEEFTALVSDIQQHGQRDPIVVHDGAILDGRNRYSACMKLGIEPVTEEWSGDDPLSFVVSKNLHRRHLNESQRAMVAARMMNMVRGDNQHTKEVGAKAPTISKDEAAKMLNVDRATVTRARTVLREGTPEQIQSVDRGEVRVRTLDKQIRNGQPEPTPGKPKGMGFRKDKTAPFEITATRHQQVADAEKERMVRALSGISGFCRGLSNLDAPMVAAVCDATELHEWAKEAKAHAKTLRELAQKLEEVKNEQAA